MKTTFTKTKAWEVLKSATVAIVVTLIAFLVCAFIIKVTGLPNSSIPIFYVIIKIVSLLVGCFFGFQSGEKGWLKGLAAGAVFTLLLFVVFGVMTGNYSIDSQFVYNLLLGLVGGMISGMGISAIKSY